ncbi:MAG: hypothetical protein ABFD54_08490, partial [Armatimonadota bacterium]
TFRIIYRFGLSLIRCFAAFGGGFGSFAVRSNYARRLTFDNIDLRIRLLRHRLWGSETPFLAIKWRFGDRHLSMREESRIELDALASSLI